MNSFKILLLFLISPLLSVGQNLEFDVHDLKLPYFLQAEELGKSEQISNKSYYQTKKGIAQPLQFLKKQEGIPNLITKYYYYKKDSVIAYILHEWDISNFEKKGKNKQSEKLQLALIDKYHTLENQINEQFGKGTIEGNLEVLEKANKKEGLAKKNIWQPNDSLEIEMYTAISNYYEKSGAVTIDPTHRIRLYIRNTKNYNQPKKLTEERLGTLSDFVRNFIGTLKRAEFNTSKGFLSQPLAAQLTDDQLSQLSSRIYNLDIDLVYHGIEIGMNETAFVMLHFKYSNEDTSAPNEIIKVLLDENDKIAGFQPLKIK